MRFFGRALPTCIYAPLLPRHAEACAALHGAGFAQGWPAIEFERLIAARSCWSDAALDGRSGSLVGFVLSRGAAGEAEILTITVDAAWRGRDIAGELLRRHMGQLAVQGMTELFLEVAENNAAARRLYAKSGFAEVGRREAYYRPQEGQGPIAALVLRRSLR